MSCILFRMRNRKGDEVVVYESHLPRWLDAGYTIVYPDGQKPSRETKPDPVASKPKKQSKSKSQEGLA